MDAEKAQLLGPVADNAVFRVSSGVVVRLASAGAVDRLAREIAVARWLAANDVLAVRPVEWIEQPLAAEAVVATFWHEIRDGVMASPVELGQALRRLHALDSPTDVRLSLLDPFVGMEDHLAKIGDLPDEDVLFLRRHIAALRAEFAQLEFVLPRGVVHGDAHRKNALRTPNGRVALLDLERFGIGPREWDLIVSAVYRRLGWYSESEYAGFVTAYGFDIRDWAGFDTLAAVRELRMTLWLAGRTGREPRLIPEARRRVASLRDPRAPRSWTPGT
ncbi:phosphotransferase enzyme family protein [Actinopolymorpha alba]|uniref:phosphotransferase enzyme family protein n=1 Tax=Actinopolymorpha alba TaxID=533267 RepID=UPI0012F7029F|nr:aminoglycoside phosphotransferase family protein [Actinopolymorpha alba]